MRVIAIIAVALLSSACGLGYSSALGFRARQAVLANDVDAFKDLMEEAADTAPKGPHDNPKKTVLTHFLDLAADPRFFPYIEEWRKKGWVADDMICSIHRAHARQNWDRDPQAAWTSVQMCLDIARAASKEAEKSWQVTDCLEGASFLTQTATKALLPFMERVADPTEPIKFRAALLDGMTRIPVSGVERRTMEDAAISREQAIADAEAQLKNVQARFEWIIAAAKPFMEATLLASGSAVGAMEIEESSQSLGRSYVGRLALSDNPEDNDLAWSWIRVMKHKKKNTTLLSLGLWDRSREPKTDVYWYLCTRPAPQQAGAPATALGPMNVIDAISVRSKERVADPAALRSAQCVDKASGEAYPDIAGPFPLESVGRGAVSGATANAVPGKRTAVVLKRRVLL